MSEKSMFSLLYYINKSKIKQNGECPVMLRITIKGRSVAMRTKRFVAINDWDQSKSKSIAKSQEANSLNLYLDALRAKVYNKYTELLLVHDEVIPELLRDSIMGVNSEAPKMLLELWEENNIEMKKLIGTDFVYSTWLKYDTCKRYMAEFLKLEYKLKDISMKSLTRAHILKFESFLKTNKKCSENTTKKYLQYLKKIVINSFKNGWIRVDPFADISLSIKPIERQYLTQDEINRILKTDFRNERLNFVKDMFIFSCYTGLAYVDVLQLKKSELELDKNNTYWIRFKRQKTGSKSHVPLLAIPNAILHKYCKVEDLLANETIFNIISNQKINAYLKEIADVCRIEKCLTFHMARHTFATTITISNGVPIETVSKMLGHKDLRSTQHYAKIVDEKVGKDMYALSQKLIQLKY